MGVLEFVRAVFYEQYCLSIPTPTAQFSHKTVIITGANTGLGREAARHISQLGCTRLILAVRNQAAGEEARKDILATTSAPESSIAVWKVDLGSFDSVAEFVKRAFRELDRLDVLICNAGLNTRQFAEAEGHERMLTVNVLGTDLMASRLLPLLERTAALGPLDGDPSPRPPHLVLVSSDTHLLSTFPERDESPDKMLTAITKNCRENSSRFGAQYATSKLLVILLVRGMANRQRRSGPSAGVKAAKQPQDECTVIINAPNPGLCRSNLTREMPGLVVRVVQTILRARTAAMGGGAFVNAASAGWETNGQYLSSNRVGKGGALTWDSALAEKVCAAIEEHLKKVDTPEH